MPDQPVETIPVLKARRRHLEEEMLDALHIWTSKWSMADGGPRLIVGAYNLMKLNSAAIAEVERKIAARRRGPQNKSYEGGFEWPGRR